MCDECHQSPHASACPNNPDYYAYSEEECPICKSTQCDTFYFKDKQCIGCDMCIESVDYDEFVERTRKEEQGE